MKASEALSGTEILYEVSILAKIVSAIWSPFETRKCLDPALTLLMSATDSNKRGTHYLLIKIAKQLSSESSPQLEPIVSFELGSAI